MSLNVMDVGQGSPMLLLHGFSGSAHSWSEQMSTWSASHRVIAPDLLGHGGSDAPGDPFAYALERQAADLVRLLDLLEAVPATLVGYSMGARLALVLVQRYPEAVAGLVLESPSAGIADVQDRADRRAADEQLAADLERHGIEAFVDRWEVLPLFASHADLSAEARQRLRAERVQQDPHALAGSLRGAGQGAMTPLHDHLGRITAPVLVVAGAFDTMGLERARAVASGIPRSKLVVIDGVGHTPHLEDPQTFDTVTADFLAPTAAIPAD
jgi:2-succinyl-6-hydroxy-2,4-cyclohexadiene-1-carboxylate synthase